MTIEHERDAAPSPRSVVGTRVTMDVNGYEVPMIVVGEACPPRRSPIPATPLCGRGTFHGAAAEASLYLFAPCVRPVDHANIGPGCDSGPVSEPAPQSVA